MSHSGTAEGLRQLVSRLGALKPYRRGERFFVERHAIERRLRELADEVAGLDPERRRRTFQTGAIVVGKRLIPVHLRAARRPVP